MTKETKLALINFTGLVTTAIVQQQEGKDVDWREIADAHNTLVEALDSE